MALSLVQSQDRVINQLQSNIKKVLDPIDQNPIIKGLLLTGVRLAVGSNTINHGLSRTLQGWVIIRKRAAASIYDTQDSNQSPTQSLILVSDASVTVDLYVF